MIFSAMKSELQSAVNIAIRAVPSHTTMNILECILIRARGDGLTLTANDMEMGIETHVGASVTESGIIAVEAKMFSDIIRKLPDDIVTFSSDENCLIHISCGKAKFQISGRSGEEFTDIPSVETDLCVTLSQFTLKNVIQNTIFSIASNENSKVMTGELFELSGDILRVVALDGHRIAIRRVALKESYDRTKVIIPGKTLLEISRILSGELEETVSIFIASNHVVFEMKRTRIVSRLIEGEFFDVDHMISNDYETRIRINRTELINCVERASLFVKEGDKKPIILEFSESELQISIDSPMGSMDETLDIGKEGKDIVIGFNPRFLLDAIKAISDEEVVMYLINPKAPCFIKDDGNQYTYLILPVNFVR